MPNDIFISYAHIDNQPLGDTSGKFYSQQGGTATSEQVYRFLLPKDRPEALLAVVPDSCAESMLQVFTSYADLLTKLGREVDANIADNRAYAVVRRVRKEKELTDPLH